MDCCIREVRRGRGLLAVLIFLVLIAVIVVVLVAVNGGTNVSYRASIVSMQPTNSAEVNVSVQVTNTGSDAGTYTSLHRQREVSQRGLHGRGCSDGAPAAPEG
jgi:hypothetical protein